jgi:hypothetical protein
MSRRMGLLLLGRRILLGRRSEADIPQKRQTENHSAQQLNQSPHTRPLKPSPEKLILGIHFFHF